MSDEGNRDLRTVNKDDGPHERKTRETEDELGSKEVWTGRRQCQRVPTPGREFYPVESNIT